MAYTLKVNYADKSNYGSARSTSKIKYIVWHYTANDGDTDEANAKYFKRKNLKASAHYFVDDDSVTISVPDTYVAWSVGGSRYSNYKTTGGAKYYKTCTNTNSINIELCDTKKDGTYMASDKTINNAIELTKDLMKKYNIPIENVIRHFDVTGKSCPSYFVNDLKWNELKKKISPSNKTLSSTTNKQNTSTPVSATTTSSEFKVKVIVNALNIRSGAGTKYKKVGCIRNKGTYTITKTSGNWGYLKSGTGWINISSSYVKKI